MRESLLEGGWHWVSPPAMSLTAHPSATQPHHTCDVLLLPLLLLLAQQPLTKQKTQSPSEGREQSSITGPVSLLQFVNHPQGRHANVNKWLGNGTHQKSQTAGEEPLQAPPPPLAGLWGLWGLCRGWG